MYHLATFELFKALRISKGPTLPEKELTAYLLKEFNVKKELSLVGLSDIPAELGKKETKKFLNFALDHVLLMNGGFPKSRSLGLQYYHCQKLLLLAEILNTLVLRTAAIVVAETLVSKSNKYYFLNLSFQAYRIIYSAKNQLGDFKGVDLATKQFQLYLKYYELEKKIEIEFNRLQRSVSASAATNPQLITQADEIINQFEEYEGQLPSFYFHYFFYYIKYIKYSYSKKHDEVFKLAVGALDYFESLPFHYTPGKNLYSIIQIIYLIQNREYDTASFLINKTKAYLSPYSTTWYRVIENELILYFHKGDFNTAVELYFRSINKNAQVSNTNKLQDHWLLYEAYINLVLETNSATYDGRRKRFSIQKFINDQPRFSKDKRAMNIPILIAQMVFFIVRKQYNKAIDRIESLDKYASRYLRNDETFRSNCFIKMLIEIPKNSFNRLRVERAAEKYFNRLLDSDIDLIDQPFEIEIIPYERLWAMIMNHLRPDHHYTPKVPRGPILTDKV